ncbi:MAG TPA: response regulator [Steroidobacteraceae bacterium]|jgi:CheY-like chemotaxis protein|nr:response regulator [Steroidobacteraceae bacterium]
MEKRPSLLRDLAHELRDALSPIRSATDLMRLRDFDAEVSRTMAQRIERGLEGALAAIDAFVMAEQYESDASALRLAPVALEELLQLTQRTVAPVLRERCTFAPCAHPATVSADAARSVQVLAAMLEHAAVTATAGEPIEVQCGGERARPDVRVCFAAELRGEEQDWFADYRARGGGSRLALRTARRLMALQGGELSLEGAAAPGQWQLIARFSPAGAVPAQRPTQPAVTPDSAPLRGAPREAAPRDGRGVQVIIVDDNAEVRRAYREGLGILGYRVSEAGDADAALRAVADAAPSVVLIDIHLPGMNGFQLAQALKARAGGAALRLVMLSGMTLDETMLQMSKNAGFDQCFDKARGPKALDALLRAPVG